MSRFVEENRLVARQEMFNSVKDGQPQPASERTIRGREVTACNKHSKQRTSRDAMNRIRT